jgi:hypothetical protein
MMPPELRGRLLKLAELLGRLAAQEKQAGLND